MKKWQFSKPKIVDWYLDFSKESYTTLKSVISSFKICLQNYGQLKRKFLRPKNTSSTFLKFELSSLSGAMLKTRKNTIRNQFEQQWFNVISFQKPRRVYPAIWYNLKPFANMKGRFKLSTPAKSRKVAKGQRTIIKITTFLRPGIGFYRTEQCLWVYVSYLSMGFLDIGIKKENLWLLSKVDGDCVTSHGLTTYHRFLGSYFEATLTTGMARGTDTLWSSSELFFTRHLPEFIGNMPTPTRTRAFVGYLSFFRGKVRVSRFTQKPFGSKNVLKLTLDMKQKVFPRNKLKNKKNNSRSE